MTRELSDFFKLNDVKYKGNYQLSLISPIKIGGNARYVAYPDKVNKLIKVVDFLRKNKIRYKIIGRMSNTLPPDDDYDGVIIRTDSMSKYHLNRMSLYAESGASLPFLAKVCADLGFSGFEELSGIPGSLGGAIRGNAGAFGREISNLVSRVTVYNFRSEIIEHLKAEKLCFDYRSSSLMNENIIILSARLNLTRSDKFTVNRLIEDYREKRMATQPVGQASLGSTFKRPMKDVHAAKLIDECGLKGHKIGGAKISEKHAGFIVNIGGATAVDYLSLVEFAQKQVYEKFGIMLEKEIEVI